MVNDEAVANSETHPAELGYVTLADLEKLVRNLGRLRRELVFVQQDVARIANYNKQVVYMLDFSELHSFLWPEESPSQYRHIISYLLTQTQLTFVMPPGAVRELLRKLHTTLSQHSDRHYLLKSIFSKPIVQAFVRASELAHGEDIEFSGALSAQVITTLLEFRTTLDALERLAKLYEGQRLKHLSAIIDNVNISPDLDVLHDAYVQLSAYRLGREDMVNFVDAHNYALTYSLNNAFYHSKHLFFLLVTSSIRPYEILETIKWREDPLFAADPENILRTSLVRHPVQLLYHSQTRQYGRNAHSVIGSASKVLLRLHESLVRIPEYKDYISRRDLPGSMKVQLPPTKSYGKIVKKFQAAYQSLYRPLAELLALDLALEQNRRLLFGISPGDAGGVYPFDESQQFGSYRSSWLQASADYRETLSLYDRIVNLAHKAIARNAGELKRYSREAVGDIDDSGEIFPLEDVELKFNDNAELRCTEITATIKGSDVAYFCADKYETFTSFYWQTTVNFIEFIKVARHFVKGAAGWVEESGETILSDRRKIYDGLCFFLSTGVKRFPLERLDLLSADAIQSLLEPHWKLRYVRIGLPYGDLCYDFGPVAGLPQRAGLITHLACFGPVSDLIQWTHSKYVSRAVVRRVIKETLQRQYSA